jgi:hypothetical protein
MEAVGDELMQQRCHSDTRIIRDGVLERQCSMRRQLDHQPLGQWRERVGFILLRVDRAAFDGNYGLLRRESNGR